MKAFYLLCGLGLVSFGAELSAAGDPAAAPAQINSEYSAALRGGEPRRLRAALEHGSPANARDARGDTPLMLAAVYGDTSCLRLLLEHGAEVNATNDAGATPLMRAADDYERVRLLLERGANVNARSSLGHTALMLAARPGNSHRTVALLLAHGADAKAANASGATALMAAAASGDEESVRLLLEHGAEVNAQPGADPVAFILGGGRSALMWAAYRGDLAIMKRLLDAGADVNGEGFAGTPLSQTAWAGHPAAARLLLDRGANINQVGHGDGYTALHWAASSERRDPTLVKLLLAHGADPNLGGGDPVDAFMNVPQTPLMLARRRGNTPIVAALLASGATKETPDAVLPARSMARAASERYEVGTGRSAMALALPLLQQTALESKKVYVNHPSHQDCVSCHQQFLPLAAVAMAKRHAVPVDKEAESQLVKMLGEGELKDPETDWQALFHPEPAYTKGYLLFSFAVADLPASETTDSWVHHLAVIQAQDGRWFNNLPRPPIQTSDVGATALAIQALQRYPLAGHKAEFAERINRARKWLWDVKAENNEERVFQLLGLAWAGESAGRLQRLSKGLLAGQREDGGWAQLAGLPADAYATGEALYALRIAAGMTPSQPAIQAGRKFLLATQLEDGTWYVRRRTFPFQPTMKNAGFPHGRDGWLSAAATSWAVLGLSLAEETEVASSP